MFYKILYWVILILFILLLIVFNVPDILSYFCICILTSIYFIIFWGGDELE